MKRPFIPILLLLLFFFSEAFSQPGFRPGYVIKNNGDTLYGIVYYSGDNKLLKECRFKHFDIGKEFRFAGNQIKGYGFRNGRAYASEGFQYKKGFMEVILSGIVTLCLSGKNELYISKDGKDPVKLTRKNINDGNQQFDDYKEYLRSLMEDQPSLLEPINNSELNLKSMSAVVREYNESSADLVEYSHTPSLNFLKENSISRNTSATRLNIRVGYEMALMHAIPNQLKFFQDGDFVPSRRPFFGIQLQQRLNRRIPGLFFDVGLGFYKDEFYRYVEYSTMTGFSRDDIYIRKKAVNLTLGLQYSISSLVHKPFLKAGVMADLIPRYSYSRYYEVEQNSIIRAYTDNEYGAFYREIGFYAAAGYDFAIGRARNLCLELQYGYGSLYIMNVHQGYLNANDDVTLITHTIGMGMRINL